MNRDLLELMAKLRIRSITDYGELPRADGVLVWRSVVTPHEGPAFFVDYVGGDVSPAKREQQIVDAINARAKRAAP